MKEFMDFSHSDNLLLKFLMYGNKHNLSGSWKYFSTLKYCNAFL